MHQFYENNSPSLFLKGLTLLEKRTTHIKNKIALYKHPELGKIFIFNNEIQHIEAWASLYHEPVVHIPIAFIKSLKSVLILGGGTLYAAHEILKYQSIEQIVLIDFDAEVIELTSRHYEHASNILRDKRVTIINAEAFSYINTQKVKFDLIINDAIDLLNHSGRFTKRNGFCLLAGKLTSQGICSDVIYRHIFEKTTTKKTVKYLKKNFQSGFSLITIPEYPGILHLLTMWGCNKYLKQDQKKTINEEQLNWRENKSGNPCEVFNPDFLPFYLYLPPYVKKLIEA